MVNQQFQISAQANFIAGELDEWAQTMAGTAQVVWTVDELWAQSSQSSQKPIIYVCPSGETPWSSNSQISAATHRVDRDWTIRIKRGRGFTCVRGNTLTQTVGNTPPFTDVVEHVRDMCRAMLGITQATLIDYKGWKPVRLTGQTMGCVDIFFSCKCDLPTILSTPDDSTT